MAKIGGILAGAAAGGFEKVGEIAEERIEATLDEKKANALAKKQENIMRLSQTFQTSEREAGQEFRKSQTSSGKYLKGKELTREELSQLSDTDKRGILTTEAYQEGVEAKDVGKEIAKEKRKHGYRMAELGAKPVSEAAKKAQAKGAFQDISAKLISLGGMQDIENDRQFVFDASNMAQEKQDQILSYLDRSGFTIEGSLDPESGIFQINLGQYDPKRVSTAGPAKPKETEEDKAKSSFDELLDLVSSQGNQVDSEVVDESQRLSTDRLTEEPEGILHQRLAPTRDIIKSGKKALKPFGDKLTEFVKKWQRTEEKDYGLRPDNTPKGSGFLGELKRPDGGISTEVSVGVSIDGKEIDIPTLVPTLTREEIDEILNLSPGEFPSKTIMDKAIKHAKERIAQGKSPFK